METIIQAGPSSFSFVLYRDQGYSPESLATVLEQLEGKAISAGAWEESILPIRLQGYMSYWLDILCSTGQFSWSRLSPSECGNGAISKISRQSPIVMTSRYGNQFWHQFNQVRIQSNNQSHFSKRIIEILTKQGAQFFDDLVAQGNWLKTDVELGLSELANLGLVTSDNYAGLRALTNTASSKNLNYRNRNRKQNQSVMVTAGRWSLITVPELEDRWQAVEYVATVLLKRYGVVFRRIVDIEDCVPGWRELQYVYRRMEARGEVRGGRFIEGIAGEQFALPEAVGLLREMNKQRNQNLISISAADPLNLTGMILPGRRVPAIRKNRILFKDGKPIAALVAGEINWLESMDPQTQWQAQQKLILTPVNKPGKYRHARYSTDHLSA